MTSHDCCPCLTLTLFFLVSITTFVANSCRVDEHICTLQCHKAGCFRIPLIPANKYTKTSYACVNWVESEIAWCEVELLIVSWIIWNMHLTIFTSNTTILLYHYGSVMIKSWCTFLKKWCHDDNTQFVCQLTIKASRGTWYSLSQVKLVYVLCLTEVKWIVQFLEDNKLRTTLC